MEDSLKGDIIMTNCAIIIPVLNPTTNLIDYVNRLIKKGIPQIIVVNDGSKEELNHIFAHLQLIEGCTVLHHDTNKGKGRALKTAFHYFLEKHHYLAGVITADADGQHSVEDVYKIAKILMTISDGLILGVRNFNQAGIPTRSLAGNRFTSFIFKLLYGVKLEDTQTGLRAIPKQELAKLLKLSGERYEYEINMLIYAVKKKFTLIKVSIQTLYFDENSSSHYRPIIDSVRVFQKLVSGLIYYSYSTIISGTLDIVSFILLSSYLLLMFPLEIRILYATFFSRLLSSSCNFYMNRKHVFNGVNSLPLSVIKYYGLCFALILASYLLILSANLFIGMNIIVAKILIDLLLGIFSYQAQLHWVFKKNDIKQMIGEGNEP